MVGTCWMERWEASKPWATVEREFVGLQAVLGGAHLIFVVCLWMTWKQNVGVWIVDLHELCPWSRYMVYYSVPTPDMWYATCPDSVNRGDWGQPLHQWVHCLKVIPGFLPCRRLMIMRAWSVLYPVRKTMHEGECHILKVLTDSAPPRKSWLLQSVLPPFPMSLFTLESACWAEPETSSALMTIPGRVLWATAFWMGWVMWTMVLDMEDVAHEIYIYICPSIHNWVKVSDLGQTNNPNTTPIKGLWKEQVVVCLCGTRGEIAYEEGDASTPKGWCRHRQRALLMSRSDRWWRESKTGAFLKPRKS